MNLREMIKNIWAYLQKDTWDSWLVSLVLIIVLIKFVFFPFLSFIAGTPLPLVVVESCSMYHDQRFDPWWEDNGQWYESRNITKSEFLSYSLRSGLNKGDIVIVWGRAAYQKGDIIIFNAGAQYPLIHRLISLSPYSTKGDNNPDQLYREKSIPEDQVIGKAVAKIPYVGWIKLIFFDIFKAPQERGLCS